MLEKDFSQEEQQVTVWRPIPQDHKRLIVSLAAAGIVILLGVLILCGWRWTIALGLLMAAAAAFTHYKLQKRIMIENGYFYLDRDELYLISLAREDEKLRAYLQESPENRKPADSSMSPNEFLMSMAKYSVICRIYSMHTLYVKKKDRYTLGVSYELVSYPYNGYTAIPLKNCYENYDSLIQLMKKNAWRVQATKK